MEKIRIYIDMDGVLADFDRGVKELCGFETPQQYAERSSEQDDLMWEKIKEVDHFYDRLEPMPGAKEMFWRIYAKYGDRCEILTGVPKPKRGILTAGEDKKAWVKRLLSPEVKVNICLRAEKIEKCTGPETILIDDLEKTILEWQTLGGTGILHLDAKETLMKLEEIGLL